MGKMGKKLKNAYEGYDAEKLYTLDEAIGLLKKFAKAKFDESVEVAMNLGVDTRHADQQVRGMIQLPNGTGKTVRVAVFARGDRAEAAKEAGADIVGDQELAAQIQDGQIDFDVCIAAPDMMAVVGKLGKILGPRGLMPNPKLGTVTPNVAEAVRAQKGGSVQFRAEKGGIVHGGVGKISFEEGSLRSNIMAYIDAVRRAKPSGAKGTYLNRVTLSTTMGPGIKIDIASLDPLAAA